MSYKYNKEDLQEAILNSNTYIDVFRYLKLCPTNYNFLKKKIQEYNLDISHFNQSNSRRGKVKYKLDEILVKNGPNTCSYSLKKKLYDQGLKLRKCELCGQGEQWNDMNISLILDHIDGDRYNNELSNLRIVCPNCNAGLDTHCGKNKKKYIRENKEKETSKHKIKIQRYIELINNSNIDISLRGYRLKISKLINITPQAVDKFLKRNIPELWKKRYKNHG
jgi:hypothetical protein